MASKGPGLELIRLRKAIADLEATFLLQQLAPPPLSVPSRSDQLATTAFLVMAHAAFEYFAENVAQWALGRIVDSWTMKQRIGRGTATLLLYRGERELPETDESVFDQVRLALDNGKQTLSKLLHKENNGVSQKHLRALFYSVGIEVPTDPVLVSSLQRLVTARHEGAHGKVFGATVVMSAQDAKIVVEDCLKLAEKLVTSAKASRP